MTASQLWLRYTPDRLKGQRTDVMQVPIQYQAVKANASADKAVTVGPISDSESHSASDHITIRISDTSKLWYSRDEIKTGTAAQSLLHY
jgi:hypothetical protein